MKNKIHTTEQPDSDVTTYVVSCGRLDLLDITLKSFFATANYKTKMVIVDDSAKPGVFEELVEKYGEFSDVVCFPENRGLWWSMDFMVSYCNTQYIFYLEDDWELTNTDYLNRSKAILERYRDIGIIDISGRTFEQSGIDSYEKKLIDNEFYYKKIWKITPYHFAWYGWCGSPNLRRRDDLVLLGRVEKGFTEWAIDRKFKSLGFKAIYLKDSHVNHLGDQRSIMASKRTNENISPEQQYPKELLENRTYPVFDYNLLEREFQDQINRNNKQRKTLVTCLLDIDREKYDARNFNHYIESMKRICETNHDLIVFTNGYHEEILNTRCGRETKIINYNVEALRKSKIYNKVKKIIENPSWVNQSDWMKNSIIRSADYVVLTLQKMSMLDYCISNEIAKTDAIYWIDSGMFSSYGMTGRMTGYDLDQVDESKFFITSWPYWTESEIHGYSVEGYKKLLERIPDRVFRATFFGGNKEKVNSVFKNYTEFLHKSLDEGYIGTEESIFSAICPGNLDVYEFRMQNGSIKNFFDTIAI